MQPKFCQAKCGAQLVWSVCNLRINEYVFISTISRQSRPSTCVFFLFVRGRYVPTDALAGLPAAAAVPGGPGPARGGGRGYAACPAALFDGGGVDGGGGGGKRWCVRPTVNLHARTCMCHRGVPVRTCVSLSVPVPGPALLCIACENAPKCKPPPRTFVTKPRVWNLKLYFSEFEKK